MLMGGLAVLPMQTLHHMKAIQAELARCSQCDVRPASALSGCASQSCSAPVHVRHARAQFLAKPRATQAGYLEDPSGRAQGRGTAVSTQASGPSMLDKGPTA